jgi:DNA-binding MarR family transcriptional regulator
VVPAIPVDELDVEIAELIGSVSRQIRIAVNRDLEPLGVTTSHVRALGVLGRAPEPMRMHELADRLRIARRTATGIVDELEARRLVARQPDPTDGRGVTVTVTAEGREMLRDIAGRRGAVVARLTARLSDEQAVVLRDLLARLDGLGRAGPAGG